MIISFLNKGGAGKTTIATNLAYYLKQEAGHRVLLVDADPQASARDWHNISEGTILEVIGLDRPTIDRDIKSFKDRYDFIFIDSGKFDTSEKVIQMAVKILTISDVLLIPVRPSPYDVWAAKAIVDLAKQRIEITEGALKTAMIVSQQIGNTRVGKEVRGVLNEYELPVFESGTTSRISYSDSASDGHTVFQTKDESAKNEIVTLANELMEYILNHRRPDNDQRD